MVADLPRALPFLLILGVGTACDATARCPEGLTESGDRCVTVPEAGAERDADAQTGDDAGPSPEAGPGCPSPEVYFADADTDGHGDPGTGKAACSLPEGYVTQGDDCDDRCKSCYPGAVEVCDGKNNDCDQDAEIDEGTLVFDEADEVSETADRIQVLAAQSSAFVALVLEGSALYAQPLKSNGKKTGTRKSLATGITDFNATFCGNRLILLSDRTYDGWAGTVDVFSASTFAPEDTFKFSADANLPAVTCVDKGTESEIFMAYEYRAGVPDDTFVKTVRLSNHQQTIASWPATRARDLAVLFTGSHGYVAKAASDRKLEVKRYTQGAETALWTSTATLATSVALAASTGGSSGSFAGAWLTEDKLYLQVFSSTVNLRGVSYRRDLESAAVYPGERIAIGHVGNRVWRVSYLHRKPTGASLLEVFDAEEDPKDGPMTLLEGGTVRTCGASSCPLFFREVSMTASGNAWVIGATEESGLARIFSRSCE